MLKTKDHSFEESKENYYLPKLRVLRVTVGSNGVWLVNLTVKGKLK